MKQMHTAVTCNQCGIQIHQGKGVPEQDYLHVHKTWGYFSSRDGKVHDFCLCENCYNHMIATFVFPIEETDATELI